MFYHPHWCGLKKCHVCWQRRYRFYNRHQVTVTPATGHIYIGDRNNHHIKILNSDLTVFHLIGSAEGKFIFCGYWHSRVLVCSSYIFWSSLMMGLTLELMGLILVNWTIHNYRISILTTIIFCTFGEKADGLGQLNWHMVWHWWQKKLQTVSILNCIM